MDDLPPALFERVDEEDDATFYRVPRLVQHIDDATVAALTDYYREVLRPHSAVLDLMSSWVSHLPEEICFASVSGLGMNAEELAANARLTERRVHDLNREPRLPYPDACFDAALIAVSIQYLVRPVEVLRETARVLRPSGRVIVATSHRCFPTKAIRAFQVLAPADRMRLVGEYLGRAGGFTAAELLDRSPPGADPLWVVSATRRAAAAPG